jgi:hypothetical protein
MPAQAMREIDPAMEVDVEVLDVTDEETRKLVLTGGPARRAAVEQEQLRERLLEITPPLARNESCPLTM